MKHQIVYALALAATLTVTQSAFAQKGNMNVSQFGYGTYTIGGKVQEHFRSANVKIYTNHLAELVFEGPTDVGVSGRWIYRGNNAYSIVISSISGKPGTGSAMIYIDQGGSDFKHAHVIGKGTQGNFEITFDRQTKNTLRYEVQSPTTKGTGFIEVNNKRHAISQAWVHLDKGGNMQLRVLADRPYDMGGSWAAGTEPNSYRISISRGIQDRDTTGTGIVKVGSDRKTLTDLSLYGDSGGAPLRVQFQPSSGGTDTSGGHGNQGNGNGLPGNTDVNSLRHGSGSFTMNGSSEELSSARVTMYRDHRITIVLQGITPKTFSGTWQLQSNNNYQVKITSGFQNATGSGNVVLSGDHTSFTLIDLSGGGSGGNFSTSFSAQ